MSSSKTIKIKQNIQCANQPKLVAFGNSILDFCFETSDNHILNKFNLSEDDQCELSTSAIIEIIKDATERYSNVKNSPGGSALNSCRILKALGEDILFFGSIGLDANGNILNDILKKENIDFSLQVHDDYPTGICVCLISGPNRCLCANIGASLQFDIARLLQVEKSIEFKQIVPDRPQIYYVEGYFIPNRFPICRFIYENYCKTTENLFVTNLSASYICESYPEEVNYLVTHADIVFANSWEMSTLTKVCGFNIDDDTIESFFKQYSKKNETKIFVITNGAEIVKSYVGNSNEKLCYSYIVKPIPKENIVDTTGAGDAFVAGFLYGYFRSKPISECIEYGCKTAGKVITQIGCRLPNSN